MSFEQIPQHIQEKIVRLRQLEQTVQSLRAQLNDISRLVSEINSTINELEKLDETQQIWKTVGGVMFPKKVSEVLTELKDRKEILELKQKSFSQQEEQNRKRLEDLVQELKSEQSLQGSFAG